jgi:hypothetical protein
MCIGNRARSTIAMTELDQTPGARKPLDEILPGKFGALVEIGSPLLACAAVCRALTEAKTFDDVRTVADDIEHLKLYGRQIKDRTLIAEATVLHARAERQMGQLLRDADERGLIGRGRPKKRDAENVPGGEHFTLEEAGIDRKLSSRAQKLAALPEVAFEQELDLIRERIVSGSATIINGGRAVMASRQQKAGDLDYAPTPPWATRALLEHVLPQLGFEPPIQQTAWEPACGEGHMAEVLREYFAAVVATDIFDYGYGDGVLDFLAPGDQCADPEWIITNPPFENKAEAFALRGIDRAKVGVAIFAQLRWLETVGRYEHLFRDHPPTLLAFFAERVPLHMGEWKPDGDTATAYIWIIWAKGQAPRAPFWIPPGCREALSKDDDRERFTARPVARIDRAVLPRLAQSCIGVGPTSAPSVIAAGENAGDPCAADDDLEIPPFLRRTADIVVPT